MIGKLTFRQLLHPGSHPLNSAHCWTLSFEACYPYPLTVFLLRLGRTNGLLLRLCSFSHNSHLWSRHYYIRLSVINFNGPTQLGLLITRTLLVYRLINELFSKFLNLWAFSFWWYGTSGINNKQTNISPNNQQVKIRRTRNINLDQLQLSDTRPRYDSW